MITVGAMSVIRRLRCVQTCLNSHSTSSFLCVRWGVGRFPQQAVNRQSEGLRGVQLGILTM